MTQPTTLNIDLSEKFPHLAGAPIVEAVIHWRATGTIDLETYRSRLAEALPDYGDAKPIRQFELAAELTDDDSAKLSQHGSRTGYQFTSRDNRYVAQFRLDGLVVSRLEPYEKWSKFLIEARRLWKLFVEIGRPTEVQRLGVRFINRIAPVQPYEIGDVLARPPGRLGTLGLPVREFLYQSTHDAPGHPYRLRVIDTIQEGISSPADGPALILDIDAFTTRAIGVDEAELNYHLERLRWLKNKAFFTLIKKSARRRFRKAKR